MLIFQHSHLSVSFGFLLRLLGIGHHHLIPFPTLSIKTLKYKKSTSDLKKSPASLDLINTEVLEFQRLCVLCVIYLELEIKEGVDHIFCCCFKKLFFASLCSFICLQAVYQLSGPED